ncbi:MAG: PAS domain S-box protein [Gammaproteobacteria bacterium]|nr:PAS domain S-box protein [Gammaproteobacteria bacterium]
MRLENLFNNLRIGEKIGLGFGLTGLLFLWVIWQYQITLDRTVADFQMLQEVYEAKKSHAMTIGRYMLEARRAEKDFLIYREKRYEKEAAKYVRLVLAEATRLWEIDAEAEMLAEKISTLILIYHTRFLAIVAIWREKNQNRNSGIQGKFRNTVHELETLAEKFKTNALYLQLLQLRHREKDYLLRGDKQYIDMVQGEIRSIRTQLETSAIPASDKIAELLVSYEKDFLALVAQNDQLVLLNEEMQKAVDSITPLLESNVEKANRMMAEMAAAINRDSRANSRMMLWIVLAASLLGVFFALVITRRITRPLIRIETCLTRLAHSDPADRIPFSKGRDEVNAMAGAVNAMSDHMERLIAWSITSMREDENRLRTQLNNVPPGAFIARTDGIIAAVNPEMADIFESTAPKLIGLPIDSLFPSLKISEDEPPPSAENNGREISARTKTGQEIPLWLLFTRIDSNEQKMLAGLLLDITARKEAEAELRKAAGARRELLRIMSQEIHTLVDGIIDASERLAKAGRSGERRKYTGIVSKSGDLLLNIADVILGHSKIQANTLALEKRDFDLHRLLKELSGFFTDFAAANKGIGCQMRLADDVPAAVHGDSGQLRRVLANLLSNAVKFTEKGEISIAVEVAEAEAQKYRIRFIVTDTGIGMDPARLQHIFEPPVQTNEPAAGNYKRPGQGLAITAKLVELMGGEILVESRKGAGSVFTVILPLDKV